MSRGPGCSVDPATGAERGAATTYAVVVAAVILTLGAGLGVVAAVVVDLRTAQAAADLAALAGASATGRGEPPCGAAQRVATANGASLRSCRVEGLEVAVGVQVAGPRWLGLAADPTARARAGPVGASPGPRGLPDLS